MEPTEKNECLRDRVSARAVGIFILLVSSLLAFAGLLVLPVFGLFFVVPLLILGFMFIFAPESRACRLLMGKTGKSQG